MKRRIILILVILMLPIVINASINNNYDDSMTLGNKFLDSIYEKNYGSLYGILYISGEVVPYEFISGTIRTNNNFKEFGFLNYEEFNISKNIKGDTYLYNANDYWTMTEEATKAYAITSTNSDLISSEDKTSIYATRITLYTEPDAYVGGSGSYNDPWQLKRPPE